ncbi:MAG TPA: hypothetical protein VLL08_11320 [Kineosporiaceae bacterium]|nr:hypothetical protein [Kineosporiaceae bacterium]
MVPTNRPIRNLTFAIDLARDLDCPILVLCSGQARALATEAMFRTIRGAAVTVSSTPRHPLFALRTRRLLRFSAAPYLDTSNKRNVALLLGRMLNWERVLFLDDDIRGLAAAEVTAAAAAVSATGTRVVGWRPVDFPDNSVVCHALRTVTRPWDALLGRRQDVFIGAGALLVDLTEQMPFFPPVYNEDWLFWHDFVVRRQVGCLGSVRQLEFNPFLDPQRATGEEFGDVLAEGLYELVHQGRSVLVGCLPEHWREVIRHRQEMLDGIERRLWKRRQRRTRTQDGYEIASVLRSVAAAREALNRLSPEVLAEFVAAWRYDQFHWNARLHLLPKVGELAEALAWLGITDVHLASEV